MWSNKRTRRAAVAALILACLLLTPRSAESASCCVPHPAAGCEIPACEQCICAADDFCCNLIWDSECAERASRACAADCGCPPEPTPTPPRGECCSSHADPGCNVTACTTCVCGVDSFCCSVRWDASCVGIGGAACAEQCGCNAMPVPTPTPERRCAGDCDGDGAVDIAEIIRAVTIALEGVGLDECGAADTNTDATITIEEIVAAVGTALSGCA